MPLVWIESKTKEKGVHRHVRFQKLFHDGCNSEQNHYTSHLATDQWCICSDFSDQARQIAQDWPDESWTSAQANGYAVMHFWPGRRIPGGLVSTSLSSNGFTKWDSTRHAIASFTFDGRDPRLVFGYSSRAPLQMRNASRTTRRVSILRTAGNDVGVGHTRRKQNSWIYLQYGQKTAGKRVRRSYWSCIPGCCGGSTQAFGFFAAGDSVRQSTPYAADPWF